MDAPAGALPAMRSPERWLAVLRIAVGLWFAKSIFTKLSVTLAWGFLPVLTASDRWLHVMPILVTKYAEGNPIGFFREFLLNTVVPNSHVYAQLTAFGEAAVGLGLVFGCCTTLAAAIGLVLVVNYGLAVQWQGSAQQGFHYMLITTLVVLFGADVGPGRLGASAPPRFLARPVAAWLGDVQQVVGPLVHRDGRDDLAHLGVDHRHGVGASIGRIEPPSIRR